MIKFENLDLHVDANIFPERYRKEAIDFLTQLDREDYDTLYYAWNGENSFDTIAMLKGTHFTTMKTFIFAELYRLHTKKEGITVQFIKSVFLNDLGAKDIMTCQLKRYISCYETYNDAKDMFVNCDETDVINAFRSLAMGAGVRLQEMGMPPFNGNKVHLGFSPDGLFELMELVCDESHGLDMGGCNCKTHETYNIKIISALAAIALLKGHLEKGLTMKEVACE